MNAVVNMKVRTTWASRHTGKPVGAPVTTGNNCGIKFYTTTEKKAWIDAQKVGVTRVINALIDSAMPKI
jgi:hypothetical protein